MGSVAMEAVHVALPGCLAAALAAALVQEILVVAE